VSGGRASLAGRLGGTEGPARGAGLAGKLAPLAGEPAPAASTPPHPSPPLPAEQPDAPAPAAAPARRRGGPPRSRPAQPTGARPVSIALDTDVREALRAFAARTQLTQPTVALRAVQAHADELEGHWRRPTTEAGSMFEGATAPPRVGPARSTAQMKLSEADLGTLADLVERWGAPSRSALLNEALRRYLIRNQDTP